MAGDTTLLELQTIRFRPRKRHEKSRNGCLRCKQQRKKCDELKPNCTRCTKRMYTCRYQNPFHNDSSSKKQGSAQLPGPGLCVSPTVPSNVIRNSVPSLTLSSGQSSVSSRVSGTQCGLVRGLNTAEERLAPDSHTLGTLDTIELSLLTHYLTHTSQTIPVDDLDLYALSVGVPNLAFKSNVVMSSLLALAAACKSHDIAKNARLRLDPQNLRDIQKLLALAERHHQASLRHIQASIRNLDSYDHVLANAALMVLYASASHSIRVHLAAAAKECALRLPNDVLPQHSQWISFTRAAHTASTAVLNDVVAAAGTSRAATSSPILDARSELPNPVLSSTDNLSPEDGPTEETKRLFLPLVASTYGRALESLHERAESTTALFNSSDVSITSHLQLQACLETLSVLERCTCVALPARDGTSVTPSRYRSISCRDQSRVSPWVARYMISVTSMESPHILRRIIMSFLNKAPAEYLNLVQSVLDSPSAAARAESWMTRDSPGAEVPLLDATHLLAMDIFAHWLVLVMLLDGVWWIGDIGEWELGQVVSLMKTQNLPGQSAEFGKTWWPETMYLLKRELSPSA
ncbi:Zn(II)2Cys6 transcription factor [Aspergillus clavatus NRRL 1]|uniref:C6 transcription factor, putative n=1 Tax=Aspergillus clavatus (strain ATCC 1007 / CBS 513.65 / DSM 816 / NCTC 3887 / NRRL 1 / QM 1276 / 107) TaxID=344612 RepID=A1C8A9_ASPCL|nr:C6 transcription factor, putative [Aspergillus clavatus NRRL 1]EAW14630.1 C6 transcription factor, putative [Aspergillus clavatus NRRL 1]